MRRIVVIVILLVALGVVLPRVLSRLSLLFDDRAAKEAVKDVKEKVLVFPPVFDPMVEATNSATFAVHGYSQNAREVAIYINNVLKDTVPVDANESTFESTNLRLYEGENIITGVAIADGTGRSVASKETMVLYTKKAPLLDITTPLDNEHFSGTRRVKIEGKTNPGATVKVNMRWAVVRSDGGFTFSADLNDGDNSFEIIAEDGAGNKTTVARIVTYSQN